jgi:hypothetical protein
MLLLLRRLGGASRVDLRPRVRVSLTLVCACKLVIGESA